jgi:hypothetical protein
MTVSTSVFHAWHCGHWPCQRGAWAPQALHTKADFADFTNFVPVVDTFFVAPIINHHIDAVDRNTHLCMFVLPNHARQRDRRVCPGPAGQFALRLVSPSLPWLRRDVTKRQRREGERKTARALPQRGFFRPVIKSRQTN